MIKSYDVIIIGAGSMGMSAGYFLAKKGIRTLLLDSFDPPHSNGSHHGDTRIIRHAYGEGKQYVPLVLRAQQLWMELQSEANRTLFTHTGVIGIGSSASSFINNVIQSAKEFDLPLEILTSDEIMNRWTGIRLPEGHIGCFEPSSGVLWSEECIKAYRELAIAYGAAICPNTKVTEINAGASNHIKVATEESCYYADKIIITAGAWSSNLVSSVGLKLPLTPLRKTVSWFQADNTLFDSTIFPAFMFHLTDALYYGFPSFRGGGIKVGRHDRGRVIEPDSPIEEYGFYAEDEMDARQFLNSYMPKASGRLVQGKVCMYTMTPDEHFIIDRHPEYGNVFIAAGFSGHGFKFSSAVGEALSQMVSMGYTEHDITPFSMSRQALFH